MLLLAALLSFSACDNINCIDGSGDTETRIVNITPIQSIVITTDANLVVKQGENQLIEVTSHPEVLDKLLEDSFVDLTTWNVELDGCVKNADIDIVVTLPDFASIAVTGDANVSTEGILDVETLLLNVKGDATYDMNVDAENSLTLAVEGDATFNLRGRADRQIISISGDATVNAFDLDSRVTQVAILGQASCQLTVSETLEIEISGDGDICYKGNPVVTSDITGDGTVDDCN